ncbi:hypothetical protein CYMTET_28875, partial [Cymbomonas tetramitiformis]
MLVQNDSIQREPSFPPTLPLSDGDATPAPTDFREHFLGTFTDTRPRMESPEAVRRCAPTSRDWERFLGASRNSLKEKCRRLAAQAERTQLQRSAVSEVQASRVPDASKVDILLILAQSQALEDKKDLEAKRVKIASLLSKRSSSGSKFISAGVYLLYVLLYFWMLSTISSSITTYQTLHSMNMVIEPEPTYPDALSIMNWYSALVDHVWTNPECGNGLCEEPYERPAFGT